MTEKISITDYQREAIRTASINNSTLLLTEGVIGLCGETGECADIVKKFLFQGHKLDYDHLAEELGDVAWYLTIAAHAIGYDLDEILLKNCEKLRKRYPDGFDPDRSINREEDDI